MKSVPRYQKYLIIYGGMIALIVLQAVIGAQAPALEPLPKPEDLLKEGLKSLRLCPFDGTKVVMDGSGREKSSKEIKGNEGMLKKLSFDTLFRPKRFHLSPVRESDGWDGRLVYIVDFSPWGNRKQELPPAPGEDEHYTKAMNQMEGSVVFDRLTWQILRIQADVPAERPVSYSFGVSLKYFWLTFLRDSKSAFEGDLTGVAFIGRPVIRDEKYHVTGRFSCAL